jgi:hypothetical protein
VPRAAVFAARSNRWQETSKSLAVSAIERLSGPKRKAQKRKLRVGINAGPVAVFALHWVVEFDIKAAFDHPLCPTIVSPALRLVYDGGDAAWAFVTPICFSSAE